MKLLRDILYGIPIIRSIGNTEVVVSKIVFDSREVIKESLFAALSGTRVDGHQYIETAIEKGAHSIICENLPQKLNEKTTYIQVRDSKMVLGTIASHFYDDPSEKLNLVAVTGTNGKTTTAALLYHLFWALGHKSGLFSTVAIYIGKENFPTTHTTPDSVNINKYMKKMVDNGCKYCFIEASSHGIHQKRIAGLKIKGAVFTNISYDHVDYHKTFDDYILTKKKLFDDLPKDAFALVNADDRHGKTMLYHTNAKQHTFSLKNASEFKVKILECRLEGMLLRLGKHKVWTKLTGSFNAYNIAAIYGAAYLLGEDDLQIVTALSNLTAVEGRFQYIQSPNNVTAIIDYAHTPDALKNVLQAIGQLRNGNEKVITVIGCGGNRDTVKRSEMARIAIEMSEQVIFTSDNPRNEDSKAIVRDMELGVEIRLSHKYLSIVNRKEAIKTAIQMARSDDIILIAGKGHEKSQEINQKKIPFDDLAMAREFLNQTMN